MSRKPRLAVPSHLEDVTQTSNLLPGLLPRTLSAVLTETSTDCLLEYNDDDCVSCMSVCEKTPRHHKQARVHTASQVLHGNEARRRPRQNNGDVNDFDAMSECVADNKYRSGVKLYPRRKIISRGKSGTRRSNPTLDTSNSNFYDGTHSFVTSPYVKKERCCSSTSGDSVQPLMKMTKAMTDGHVTRTKSDMNVSTSSEVAQRLVNFPVAAAAANEYCPVENRRFQLRDTAQQTALAVANLVKQDYVFAPKLFNLIFSAMLMDACRDDRSGIRTAPRTVGQLLNQQGMRFQWRLSTTTVN
nr:unnamed protein product [Spirometra erinaceieuropaei]